MENSIFDLERQLREFKEELISKEEEWLEQKTYLQEKIKRLEKVES